MRNGPNAHGPAGRGRPQAPPLRGRRAHWPIVGDVCICVFYSIAQHPIPFAWVNPASFCHQHPFPAYSRRGGTCARPSPARRQHSPTSDLCPPWNLCPLTWLAPRPPRNPPYVGAGRRNPLPAGAPSPRSHLRRGETRCPPRTCDPIAVATRATPGPHHRPPGRGGTCALPRDPC